MIGLQFFTDCLFLALHLIPLAVSCASDFSLWFANRFRTESNRCQNVEREKQPVVFWLFAFKGVGGGGIPRSGGGSVGGSFGG